VTLRRKIQQTADPGAFRPSARRGAAGLPPLPRHLPHDI